MLRGKSKIRLVSTVVEIVFVAIVALSSVIVYLDATERGIGDISRHKKGFNKSAGYWAIATLFVWPCALPYYLRMRHKMIEAAAEYPIQENWRALKAGIITLLAGGLVLVSVAFPV